jgi:hypothetical protein
MSERYYDLNDDGKPVVNKSIIGNYVYCSWGYDQTNIDFAKIVRISDSGRTIFCKKVNKDVVDTAKTSKKVKPKDKTKGEEFGLRVKKGSSNDIYFKGSYPMVEDGSTRSGMFMLTEGRSFSETRSGFGH